MPRLARWLPRFCLLSLVAVTFSLLPAPPALARRVENRMVTNLIPEFDNGKLQRTSVAPDKTSTLQNDGSITLSPVGYISNWQQSSFPLPERVSDHGAVAINGRIYILGGTVFANLAKAPTDNVWMGTPGPDGNLADPPGGTPAWQALADLPPVPPNTTPGVASPCAQSTTVSAARSSVAAAGFSTGTGGFIYAIGGALAQSDGNAYSTSAVAIGKVEADGTISSWRSPLEACLPTKMQATSATVMEIQGEKFLYVVGGLYRQAPRGGVGIVQEGLKTVYFARINSSTGDLSRVSDGAPGWDTGFDFEVPDFDPLKEEGVWNATLIPVSGEFGGQTYFALYLMGGENVPASSTPSDSATVYRGIIDPATKKVAWNVPINGGGTFSAALNSARRGLRAIVYDNTNVIVTGGKQGGGADGAINNALSNQIDDNMELPIFGGNVNFYNNEGTLPQGRGRYNHGAVVVEVGTDRYVYVLGGVGNANAGEGDQTDTVFYGKIATDPNENAGYALNGRYSSGTYPIDISKAKLLAVRWETEIDRAAGAMDIQLEYRVNNDPNKLDTSWSEWFTATDPQAGGALYSKNGQNASTLDQGLEFIFFEYRVFMTTYRPSGSAWKTPVLKNVGIEVEVPGYPNLQIPTANAVVVADQIRGLQVTVANKNPKPEGSPLQPVDEGSNGQFFVDVFVFAPGQTATPPTLGQTGQAYAKLYKRDFPPEASRVVNSWLDGSPGAGSAPYNITKLFTQAGTYTIYVMVDSLDGGAAAQNPFGFVQEADVAGQDGEADNVYGPITVNITTPCPPEGCVPLVPPILLPLVFNQ